MLRMPRPFDNSFSRAKGDPPWTCSGRKSGRSSCSSSPPSQACCCPSPSALCSDHRAPTRSLCVTAEPEGGVVGPVLRLGDAELPPVEGPDHILLRGIGQIDEERGVEALRAREI